MMLLKIWYCGREGDALKSRLDHESALSGRERRAQGLNSTLPNFYIFELSITLCSNS